MVRSLLPSIPSLPSIPKSWMPGVPDSFRSKWGVLSVVSILLFLAVFYFDLTFVGLLGAIGIVFAPGTVVAAAVAVSGIAGALASRTVGLGRRTFAFVTGSAAIAGGVLATSATGMSAGAVVTGLGGPVIAAIIAISVDNPFMTMLLGASILFFLLDPISSRGGFLASLSFAVKIVVVSMLAYFTVVYIAPNLSTGAAAALVVSRRG